MEWRLNPVLWPSRFGNSAIWGSDSVLDWDWLRTSQGYALSMKTTVSIPDEVFAEAERLASRLQISRSKLYAKAIAEFLARHDEENFTQQVNHVLEQMRQAGDSVDESRSFLTTAAQQIVPHSEW